MFFTIEQYANDFLAQTFVIPFRKFDKSVCPKNFGWTFEWSNCRKAVGDADPKTNTIRVSRWFIENSDITLETALDVVRHETAHAIDFEIRNKSNHDRIWKHIARTVGADPTRTVDTISTDPSVYKYTAVCPNGCKSGVSRKWKNRKSCGKCHPLGFSERYELKLVQNY